jgi:hypothetical protein
MHSMRVFTAFHAAAAASQSEHFPKQSTHCAQLLLYFMHMTTRTDRLLLLHLWAAVPAALVPA